MGAGNVAAVVTYWSHLEGAPYKLLVQMALSAKDADDPALFWGGPDMLAGALGRRPPHDAADHRAVRRGLKQLRAVGAITDAKRAGPGQRAEYALMLRPTADAERPPSATTVDAERPPIGGRSVAATVDAERPERRTLDGRTADAERPPKEVQEDRGVRGTTTRAIRLPYGATRTARCCASCGHPIAADEADCGRCGSDVVRSA